MLTKAQLQERFSVIEKLLPRSGGPRLPRKLEESLLAIAEEIYPADKFEEFKKKLEPIRGYGSVRLSSNGPVHTCLLETINEAGESQVLGRVQRVEYVADVKDPFPTMTLTIALPEIDLEVIKEHVEVICKPAQECLHKDGDAGNLYEAGGSGYPIERKRLRGCLG